MYGNQCQGSHHETRTFLKCKTINLSWQLLLCSLHCVHNTIPLTHQRAQNITIESTAQHTMIQGTKITGEEPHGITRQHLRGKAQCVLNPWSHDTTGLGGQASSQSALLTILSVPPLSNLCRTQQRTPVTRPITNNYATDTVTLTHHQLKYNHSNGLDFS